MYTCTENGVVKRVERADAGGGNSMLQYDWIVKTATMLA